MSGFSLVLSGWTAITSSNIMPSVGLVRPHYDSRVTSESHLYSSACLNLMAADLRLFFLVCFALAFVLLLGQSGDVILDHYSFLFARAAFSERRYTDRSDQVCLDYSLGKCDLSRQLQANLIQPGERAFTPFSESNNGFTVRIFAQQMFSAILGGGLVFFIWMGEKRGKQQVSNAGV